MHSQRIVLGNERFVGRVTWRQLEQTFDAFTVLSKPGRVTVFGGYAGRAKRIFGDHNTNPILANTDLPFLPISTEAAFLGEIPRLPFIMPGTTELADAVGKAAQDSHAVLLKNHGLLVAGMSLRKAADMAEVVERTAEIILGCYAVGKEPPVLPDDVVAQLREMGEMMA